MSGLAVQAQGLAKEYRIGEREPYRALRDVIARPFTRGRERSRARLQDRRIWALRDVALEVEEGQAVGLIGANGAGKSTLLKILARITRPTLGWADIKGRVGSLLEVGTGFHPELTGRENVFMSGAVLGMTRREIIARFDDIVDFAEVPRFIDTPVKHYSSGMYVRLAFAVAAHLEPDVLLVDEVLAVGDIAFQQKCLGKMENVASEGRTVLFVSHNMAAVQSLCSSAVLLGDGQVTATGSPAAVVEAYVRMMSAAPNADLAARPDRQGDGRLRLTRVGVRAGGTTGSTMVVGQPASLVVDYEGGADLRNVQVSIGLLDQLRLGAAHVSNETAGQWFRSAPARGAFVCDIDRVPLVPGSYQVNVHVVVNGHLADWVQDAGRIQVLEGDFYGSGKLPPPGYGSVLIPQSWLVEDRD